MKIFKFVLILIAILATYHSNGAVVAHDNAFETVFADPAL